MSPTLAEEGLTIPDAPAEPGEFERSLRATRESGRKLLIAYVTGGLHDEWPDVVRAVADAGADAIEIGIPFSDPVMDGPVIQEASELALRDGASPVTVLDTLRTIDAGVPLAVMTYYNLAFHMGHERFASLMYEAGVRAAILPDLPGRGWSVGIGCRSAGIETVMLAALTAPDERLPRVVARSRGFVYAVGLLGVTGERDALAESSLIIARRLKAITDKPVLVGVGVSNGEQAAEVSQVADGCVIGSALMRRVVAGEGPAGAGAFIAEVRAALDAS